MKIDFPESLNLAHLPTPIQEAKRLPEMPNDFVLNVKRDDLTEFICSGNKIRKLEYVLAQALKQKTDCLITCGGEQSNHARATAALAARLNLETYLVLASQDEPNPDGNLFLDRILGAKIKYISEDDYHNRRDQIMQEMADELRKNGHNPYVIPEGASNPLGTWGYIRAGQEIKDQIDEKGLNIDRVVLASSSGGTYAGLFISSKLLGWNVKITGFNVNHNKDIVTSRIWDLVEKTRKEFKLDFKADKAEIHIVDGYIGAGYAKTTDKECRFLRSVASATGLILDPVYTGKALFGLIDQMKNKKISQREKVLFLHTGGAFGLFAYKDRFFGQSK